VLLHTETIKQYQSVYIYPSVQAPTLSFRPKPKIS